MQIQVKWFPRSWVQLKFKGKIVYIDPSYLKTCFKDHPTKIEFSSWPDPIDGLPEELEKGDLILITHHHKDHCKRVTVDRLSHKHTLIIAPGKCVKELGNDITIVKVGDKLVYDEFTIKAVAAYNTLDGSATKKQHKKGVGVGYLITMGNRIVYHAGDTSFIPEMNELEKVDLAFLPIDGKFSMDFDEAIEAAKTIKPTTIVAIHRFNADPIEFAHKLKAVPDVNVVLLEIGESYYE